MDLKAEEKLPALVEKLKEIVTVEQMPEGQLRCSECEEIVPEVNSH